MNFDVFFFLYFFFSHIGYSCFSPIVVYKLIFCFLYCLNKRNKPLIFQKKKMKNSTFKYWKVLYDIFYFTKQIGCHLESFTKNRKLFKINMIIIDDVSNRFSFTLIPNCIFITTDNFQIYIGKFRMQLPIKLQSNKTRLTYRKSMSVFCWIPKAKKKWA